MNDEASTRIAVYYGDRLHDACSVLTLTGRMFDDANVISPATFTKLRRRYKGAPVERNTRDRIVAFLKRRPDAKARCESIGLDIEQVLLPATWCLTDLARLRATRVGSFARTAEMRRDHVDNLQVRGMLNGGFAVRKHIAPLAEHIFNRCREAGLSLPDCETFEDLLDDHVEYQNECFAQIYRRQTRVRVPQLELVGGTALSRLPAAAST